MTIIEPALGTLFLTGAGPNPNGASQSQLFLLSGDPAAAPVREIIPAEGVTLPPAPADNHPDYQRDTHLPSEHVVPVGVLINDLLHG